MALMVVFESMLTDNMISKGKRYATSQKNGQARREWRLPTDLDGPIKGPDGSKKRITVVNKRIARKVLTTLKKGPNAVD